MPRFFPPAITNYLGQRANRCPVVNNSSVRVRVLAVCQHGPVRYLIGIPASAINQTMPAAAVKVSYSYVLRIPPENMNHNAEFSLDNKQHIFPIGSRFLIKVPFFPPLITLSEPKIPIHTNCKLFVSENGFPVLSSKAKRNRPFSILYPGMILQTLASTFILLGVILSARTGMMRF